MSIEHRSLHTGITYGNITQEREQEPCNHSYQWHSTGTTGPATPPPGTPCAFCGHLYEGSVPPGCTDPSCWCRAYDVPPTGADAE